MLNLKKVLTKILVETASLKTKTTNFVYVSNFTLSGIDISANGTYTNTEVSIASAVPAGYTPFLVMCGATGANDVVAYHCRLGSASSKTAVLQLRSFRSTAMQVSPIIVVLSIKA